MIDEQIEVEKIIEYYKREIDSNNEQIETIINNFLNRIDCSVITLAVDYAILKNKKEASFIIDTLNQWIRFGLTTTDKVKDHLGLSSTSSNSLSNSEEAYCMIEDIEKDEIIRSLKKKIGNRIGIEKELLDLFKEVEPKVVTLCIDYCSKNKKASLPSFMKTINEWKAAGLTTSEKVEIFLHDNNINLNYTSKNIKPNNVVDSKNKKTGLKVSKSDFGKVNTMEDRFNGKIIKEVVKKTVFNEDSFNQIEYYYRKYFNDDNNEVANIREFCSEIDNSIIFRSLVYAKSINKNNYKYLESFVHRLKEKNIFTLQELNNYLN
ncbi:replication initiation and membrane attachment [Clostridium homopropionicum DSM 5847]|uniref:Replication initiation and membrane attachment n=1 Tax=Clostridium homopropionicum DSM 5847 TaxID=1121318 RepID=A0A0L6Z7W7_9CLOT|nr:DnaD domain protein [Clostridium homopropionicum]KOA19062.1 replication initiation and membrane attachment [Clostridium homopropionicum DSM 5847]SFG91890.1 DnaD and phage-associated domain-containing protein [Clostridium homopropionicum]